MCDSGPNTLQAPKSRTISSMQRNGRAARQTSCRALRKRPSLAGPHAQIAMAPLPLYAAGMDPGSRGNAFTRPVAPSSAGQIDPPSLRHCRLDQRMVRLRTLLRTKSPRRCRPGREPIRRRGSTEPCGQLAASKTRDADWAGLRRATSVAADHRGGFTEAGAPIPFARTGSFFHRTRSRRDVPRHAPDLPRANPRSGIHFEARSP